MWQREGIDFALPDIPEIGYMLEWFQPHCLGWFHAGDMGGLHPLTWSEIDAFSRLSGSELDAWEAQQIRLCSVAYVTGYRKGQQPMTVSPAFEDRPEDDPGIAVERHRISEQMKVAFESAMGQQEG